VTTQTQKLIDLADILTVRMSCDDCGCTLSFPVSRDINKAEEFRKLDTCPMCRRPWVSQGDTSYQPLIAKFLSGLNDLRNTLGSTKLGFSLSLEVPVDNVPKEKQ
jgi:hypothetical protein